MDKEKFGLSVFGLAFLAAMIFGLLVNLVDLRNIIGVFILFCLIVFIGYSDKVLEAMTSR